jgi:NAD(P)-dependent dehydrogenase (short-subunit alcohol dehydrogenase family)
MELFDLGEKVVVVTGGAGAIGGELSKHLAKAGCKVIVMGRTQEKVDAKVEEIKSFSPDSYGMVCDVLDLEALKLTNQKIIDRFGKIDILINAAGGNIPGATQLPDQNIFDLEIGDIDKAIDLNLKGTLYPSLVFGKSIAESGYGSIINISSMATYSAITRVMGYSVAKTGVNSMTNWMAVEMAKKFGDKVRVNAVAPGFFIGEQNRKLLIKEDGSLTERSEKIINNTPMGRFGEISELVGSVHFLCSDAASFITGVILPVDGGFRAFSGV